MTKASGDTPGGKTDDRLRDRLKEYLGLAAATAAAIGIVLGIYEYRQREDLARARYTMEQIDIWETRGARAAYQELSQGAARIMAATSPQEVQQILEKPELLRRARNRIGQRLMKSPEDAAKVEEVVYFFTRLSLCIEAGLCEEEIAAVFFDDTLGSFMDLFRDALREAHQERPGFLDPLFDLDVTFSTRAGAVAG